MDSQTQLRKELDKKFNQFFGISYERYKTLTKEFCELKGAQINELHRVMDEEMLLEFYEMIEKEPCNHHGSNG